jgi:Spy/CpxP family protein refolding chaperone
MNLQHNVKTKVWGALLGVFLLGSVTGAAINGLYRSRANEDGRAPSMKDGDAYFQLLNDELKLTSDQATRIEKILDETRVHYKSICSEVRPRYDHLRADARARMREVLVPEQHARFDEIVTRENCNCPDQMK